MCRHTAPREQSGANLEGGEWLGNGYEPKRWPQDGVTKYSRAAGLKYIRYRSKKMMFNVFLSVCSQLGLSNAGHFLGWQLQTGLKYLVQAPGPPSAEWG